MKKRIVLSLLIALSCTMVSVVAMEQGNNNFETKKETEGSDQSNSSSKAIPSLVDVSLQVIKKEHTKVSLINMLQMNIDLVLKQKLLTILAERLIKDKNLQKFVIDKDYHKKFDGLPEDISNKLGCALMEAQSGLIDSLFGKLVSKKLESKVTTMKIFKAGTKTMLASGSNDGTICIYDITNLDNIVLKEKRKDHKSWVRSLAVYNQGTKTILASGSDDGIVCFYDMSDLDTIVLKKKFENNKNWHSVESLAYNQGTKTILLSGFSDGTVFVYDITNLDKIELKEKLNDHKYHVRSLVVYNQGTKTMLASGSDDGTVCVYDMSDLDTIVLKKKLKDHKYYVRSLVVYNQGTKTILASGSNDGTVCFYDMSDLDTIVLKKKFKDNKNWHSVESLAAYNQGTKTILLSGSVDGTVCVYDMSDLDNIVLKKQRNDHKKWIRSLVVYNQGTKTILASGSNDGTICFYYSLYNDDLIDLSKGKITAKQALLLVACLQSNEALDLNKHSYLDSIFKSLKTKIQDLLLKEKMVIPYFNPTFSNIAKLKGSNPFTYRPF